jgi:hypothetical protein
MRVTDYLKQHPVTSAGTFYNNDMPSLLSETLRQHRFPPPLPLPPPRNVITGSAADPLTGFRLELSALSRGHDRALYIPAADAAFLSLRPREKPVLSAFRSRNRIYLQNIYFLDSFTPDSLTQLYAFANPITNDQLQDNKLPPPLLALRNAMAQRALCFIASHDNTLDDSARRFAKEYRQNSSPSSPDYFLSDNLYKTYYAAVSPAAGKAFDYLRKYHTRRLTGLNIPLPLLHNGQTEEDAAKESLEYIAQNPGRTIPTVFFALSFASLLCRQLSPAAAYPSINRKDPPRQNDPIKETPIDHLLRS